MKEITKYIAEDGDEFTDKKKCEKHEENVELAEFIISALPHRPDSNDFSNGGGYLQHNEDHLLRVRNKLLEFVKRYADHKFIQQSIDKGFDAHSSWAGRIIDECCPRSIGKLWHRFQCIDSEFREWGQPYYASNPKDATLKRLNN